MYDFPEGQGATMEELSEYEAIIKKIMVKNTGRYRLIKGEPEKVYKIYKKMTLAQRSNACQLPPPPPPPPTIEREEKP